MFTDIGKQLSSVASGGFSVSALLCAGLAVLTLALLVLMRTRWGQANPLAKCIVLSVWAHFLLFGYACVTQLFVEAPPAKRGNTFEVAFIQDDARQDEQPNSPEKQPPWENLAANESTPPTPVSLDRVREPASEAPLRDADFQPPELASTQPNLSFEPTPLTPKIRTPQPPPLAAPQTPRRASNLTPALMAPRETPTQRTDSMATPTPATLARQDQRPQPKLLRRSDIDEIEQALHDVQTLVEAPHVEREADAMQGLQDQLAAAATAPVENKFGPIKAAPLRRLGDGALMPELFQDRFQPQRLALVLRQGGSEQTEEAVSDALQWLAANQANNGAWRAAHFGAGREMRVDGQDRAAAGARADTGITGLALLAFLGAGHTQMEGDYRQTVEQGLNYLASSQHANGNLAGNASTFAAMYCHAMAALAMSEAFALTGQASLRAPLERALQFSLQAQDPQTGGWRYRPGDAGDTSQFGWQVMFLKSVQLGGFETPAATRAGMRRFLQSVSGGEAGGLASYRPGQPTSPTMTAEALACRYFLGEQIPAAALRESAALLVAQLPNQDKANLYYWYYATLALFHHQGAAWQEWNAALQPQLLERQRRDGDFAGSWDANTVWGGYGGRVYSTAMAALCLEVYYRYSPAGLRR